MKAKQRAALTEIYDRDGDLGVRKEVIDGLFVQNNAALAAIARRNESGSEGALEELSHMKSNAVADYLLELFTVASRTHGAAREFGIGFRVASGVVIVRQYRN